MPEPCPFEWRTPGKRWWCVKAKGHEGRHKLKPVGLPIPPEPLPQPETLKTCFQHHDG
jgi:hypothetical protein